MCPGISAFRKRPFKFNRMQHGAACRLLYFCLKAAARRGPVPFHLQGRETSCAHAQTLPFGGEMRSGTREEAGMLIALSQRLNLECVSAERAPRCSYTHAQRHARTHTHSCLNSISSQPALTFSFYFHMKYSDFFFKEIKLIIYFVDEACSLW